MCVVQVHILDGACRDRGWLEKARLPMALERNCPSVPMETPTTNRDRREEKSLRRELSAGYSEGKVLSARDKEVSWTKPGRA